MARDQATELAMGPVPVEPPAGVARPSDEPVYGAYVDPNRPLMRAETIIAWLIGLLAVTSAAALLQYEPPSTVRLPWLGTAVPETCGAKRNFGVDCPGCGLTRSFILAADGRFRAAFAMHPAGTIGFLFLVALIPVRLWQGYRVHAGRPPQSTILWETMFLVGLLGASCLWWMFKLTAGF